MKMRSTASGPMNCICAPHEAVRHTLRPGEPISGGKDFEMSSIDRCRRAQRLQVASFNAVLHTDIARIVFAIDERRATPREYSRAHSTDLLA